jgi:hypothetical protein
VAGVWLSRGPLAGGWARRAGTPARLLASTAPAATRARTAVAARPAAPRVPALQQPFSAGVRGTVHQGVSAGGMAVVDLRMRLSGAVSGVLRVRIAGDSAPGGGVAMRRSAVALGPRSQPGRLQGRIDALQGSTLEALVGGTTGPAVRLRLDLALNGSSVRGTVSGRPVTAANG